MLMVAHTHQLSFGANQRVRYMLRCAASAKTRVASFAPRSTAFL